MHCPPFALLSDLLDNALAEPVRRGLELHLATCPGCRHLLETTQAAILLYRNLPADTLDDRRRERLCRAVLARCTCRTVTRSTTFVL